MRATQAGTVPLPLLPPPEDVEEGWEAPLPTRLPRAPPFPGGPAAQPQETPVQALRSGDSSPVQAFWNFAQDMPLGTGPVSTTGLARG